MNPTLVIPRLVGLEPPTEKIPAAPFQRDQSIEAALEVYLEAKQILANAESVVSSAREELESQLRNRIAVETDKYKVWWNIQRVKGFWTNPTVKRPLKVFEKGK